MPARRSIVTVALAFAVSMLGLAGAAGAQDDTRPNSLVPGAWALQFRVSENFNLTSFEGNTISIKKQLSSGTALRFGLTPSVRMTSFEVSSDGDSLGVGEEDLDSFSLGLSLHWLRYVRPGSTVNLFWGGGPEVAYRHASRQIRVSIPIEEDNESWQAGLTGLVGVEWFATRSLGLHGEYGTSLSYTSDTTERRAESGTLFDTSHSAWSFVGQGVKVGASLYF
jgi:opacity protein-like surface antigen